METANAPFKTETAGARAQLRASVNAAMATYQASGKTDADQAAFCTAVQAARAAFAADPTVIAAKAERQTAVSTARTAYKAALKAARDAFFAATGHKPWGKSFRVPHV